MLDYCMLSVKHFIACHLATLSLPTVTSYVHHKFPVSFLLYIYPNHCCKQFYECCYHKKITLARFACLCFTSPAQHHSRWPRDSYTRQCDILTIDAKIASLENIASSWLAAPGSSWMAQQCEVCMQANLLTLLLWALNELQIKVLLQPSRRLVGKPKHHFHFHCYSGFPKETPELKFRLRFWVLCMKCIIGSYAWNA